MNHARAVGKTPTDGENCAFLLLKGLVLFSVIYRISRPVRRTFSLKNVT